MANYSPKALSRVGRLLNGNEAKGHLARLADCMGVGRKAVHNWTRPEDDAQYRAMPPIAKRSVAILAYFAMTGALTEERMKDIVALQEAMEESDERFQRIAGRLRRMVAVADGEEPGSAKPAAGEEPGKEHSAAA